jgi:phage head maturation protease
MCRNFYGYAALYGRPDNQRNIFAHGCFAEFLKVRDYLMAPMVNENNEDLPIGRWVKITEDGFGLIVWGELNDQHPALQAPYPGLSVMTRGECGP